MKLTKESNSTDRLLGIIRGKKDTGSEQTPAESSVRAASPSTDPGAQSAPKSTAPKSRKGRKSFSLKRSSPKSSAGGKAFTVGVDIGEEVVRMVKLKGPDGKRRLVDVKRSYFNPQVMPVDSPAFRDFLKGELKSICGKPGTCEIWSLIPSAKADIWHLRIPNVAKKQVPEAVYWAVKKEKQFDEAELMLDFEVQGQTEEKGTKRLQIMAYLVPRADVNFIKKLFADTGYKLAGLTVSSLALQTLFSSNWVKSDSESFACLYVGRDWSRIDIFQNGSLVLNRGIKTGTNSMVEALMENFNEQARRARPKGRGVMGLADDEPVISLSLEDDDDILEDDDITLEETPTAPGSTSGGAVRTGGAPAGPQASDDDEEEIITLDLDDEYDAGMLDDEPTLNTSFEAVAAPNDVDDSAMPELTLGGDEDEPTQTWSAVDDLDIDIITENDETSPEIESPRQESSSMTMNDARGVFFGKLLGRDVAEDMPGAHLNGAQVFDLVLPAAGRLVRQIERTFDYHTTTQGNQRVEKIFLSGAVCTSPQIMQYLDGQLGTETQLLDPLNPGNSVVAGQEDKLPKTPAERLDMNLSLALALCSDATTPNILNTYAAREKERQNVRVNQLIYVGFIFIAIALAGVYLWQQSVINQKQKTLTSLDQRLAQYNPRVSQDLLLGMASSIIKKRKRLRVVGDRYESLAVFRELSSMTPAFIPLIRTDLAMHEYDLPGQKKDDGKGQSTAEEPDTLVIEGVILGDSKLYDPALTNYLIKLENSPIFDLPSIQESSAEDFHTQGRVLRFVLNTNIE